MAVARWMATLGWLAMMGCIPEPATDLEVVADPARVDLGTVQTQVSVPVRLANVGTAQAELTEVRLTGAMADFAGVAEVDLPVVLEPGATVELLVALTQLPQIDDQDLGLVLELDVSGAGEQQTLLVPVYVIGDARCDLDGDGFYDVVCGGRDCDDSDSRISPDAVERCNGVDDDCSGVVDNDPIDGRVFYLDADGDGVGIAEAEVFECEAPDGYVEIAGDCAPSDPSIAPGADEVCDGVDQDCDGLVDNNPVTGSVFYLDRDADGFGDLATARIACEAAPNRVANGLDCNDRRPNVNPDGVERCNGLDDDCDGSVDDNPVDAIPYYVDADGDGVGSGQPFLQDCALPDGFSATNTDCNDTDASAFPGGQEVCDGIDNDCNGAVDEAGGTAWFIDGDGDGFGAGISRVSCEAPEGYVDNNDDCGPASPDVYPGAPEQCDGVDQDCDGVADNDVRYYIDVDNDGFGDPERFRETCEQPPGSVLNGDDCDDADAAVNPSAEEVCNSVDDNCDGLVDDGDVCPCPVVDYGDRAFAFCTSADLGLPLTWRLASQACAQAGYTLARITSADENDFVAQTAQSFQGGNWWIGANDIAREGTFVWADGSPLAYSQWDRGEPNNVRNEDCAEMRPSGFWNDVACRSPRPFVCSTD